MGWPNTLNIENLYGKSCKGIERWEIIHWECEACGASIGTVWQAMDIISIAIPILVPFPGSRLQFCTGLYGHLRRLTSHGARAGARPWQWRQWRQRVIGVAQFTWLAIQEEVVLWKARVPNIDAKQRFIWCHAPVSWRRRFWPCKDGRWDSFRVWTLIWRPRHGLHRWWLLWVSGGMASMFWRWTALLPDICDHWVLTKRQCAA